MASCKNIMKHCRCSRLNLKRFKEPVRQWNNCFQKTKWMNTPTEAGKISHSVVARNGEGKSSLPEIESHRILFTYLTWKIQLLASPFFPLHLSRKQTSAGRDYMLVQPGCWEVKESVILPQSNGGFIERLRMEECCKASWKPCPYSRTGLTASVEGSSICLT